MAKKTYEPKEHIWYLEVDGEEKVFKCLVTETECITYEGNREHKHLKVMNPVRKDRVLQIDTITTIYGQKIPFQLENGVPYINWDGGWKMSETNRQDRIAKTIQITKITSWMLIGGGVGITLLGYLLGSDSWVWYMGSGVLAISGCMSLANLKSQMNLLREAEEEEAKEKAQRLGKNIDS